MIVIAYTASPEHGIIGCTTVPVAMALSYSETNKAGFSVIGFTDQIWYARAKFTTESKLSIIAGNTQYLSIYGIK